MKSLLLPVAFLLLVFNQSSGVRNGGAGADLVDDTCMNTYSPVFCTLPLSADAKVLACIMLQVVQTNSNIEMFDQVKTLLGQANWNNVFSVKKKKKH